MQRRPFLQATASLAAAVAVPRIAGAADPLTIGAMLPHSGPGGMFGPAAKACAELAVARINAAGGLLGRPIQLVHGDAGAAPAEAAQSALKLWKGGKASAIVGMHDSAVRGALVNLFKGQVPYVYTPVYEGGECARGTYLMGETPPQQLLPVIPWLAAERRPARWYLIGNDYVWGRKTNATAREAILKTGAQVVGDEYLPFTVDNFDSSLARIRDSGADAVLVSLVGGASVAFNKAFASLGLAERALRLGTLIEENTLAGIGFANARNLYATAGYFGNLDTPAARAFAASYAERFGKAAPPLSTLSESVYEGLLMLQAIAARARSLDVAAMDAAAEGASCSGPRGTVTMKSRHVEQDVYVADVTDKGFRIVKTFARVGAGQACKA